MSSVATETTIRQWNARAIYQNRSIDVLHDRQTFVEQTFDGPDGESFKNWINMRALPWLRAEVVRLDLSTSDPQELVLSEFKYEVRASTNGSYGYLYITATEDAVIEAGIVINESSKKEERVVETRGQKFVIDDGFVLVGTEGTIIVNGIGDAKVIGYYNENYGQIKLACLRVEVKNPPKWMIEQQMRDDAKKLVKEGKLPKHRNSFDNEPSTTSAAYKIWKKEWKMKSIVLWPNDFKPKV